MALNPIRLDTSIETSIKTKRLLTATSDEFCAPLLDFDTDASSFSNNSGKCLEEQLGVMLIADGFPRGN